MCVGASAVVAALPDSASAYRYTTGGTGSTLTIPGGPTTTISVFDSGGPGTAGLFGATTLNGFGNPSGAFYNPSIPLNARAVAPQLSWGGCGVQPLNGAPASCPGMGFMNVVFSQPVQGPRLHISELGGYYFLGASIVAGGFTTLSMTSASNGATAVTPQLAVTGNSSIAAAGSAGITVTSVPTSINCQAGAPPAGCGTARILPTVTNLGFNLGMVSRRFAGTVQWDVPDAFAIAISVPEDYGDAPASYEQGVAASHVIGDLRLGGAAISEENDTTPNTGNVTASPKASATASSDAEDDGAVFRDLSLAEIGATYVVPITISGASKAGRVCGWVDFNRNGTFDAATEQSCTNFAAGATSSALSFTVPANTQPGATIARARISYDQTMNSPTGLVDSGEVEDFPLTIRSATDLQVVKAGPATVVQGGQVTYTITVTNNGPAAVTGASVADTVPAALTGVTWSCTAAGTADCDTTVTGTGASGSGNAIALGNVRLDTAAGNNTLTLTVTGTAATAGSITNTATVAPPAGVSDSNTANNSSSVVTTVTPAADLEIAKSGPATVVQGGTVTYTITVTNAGPSDVTGASVADTVPANLTGVTWTCVAVGTADCDTAATGTGGGGTGNAIALNAAQLNAGAGNSLTLSVTGTAGSSGSITNTATVATPAGTTDPTPANNTSSVPTTVTPAADLEVVKTGPTTAVQGTQVTYTIDVTNNGPSGVAAATVADTVPAALTGVTWTCVAAGAADCDGFVGGTGASGSGNAINLTGVVIPAAAGNRLTISVTGTASTTGTVTNTATVAPPAGTTDPTPANNTSSVTTTITPTADLQITKSGPSTITGGQAVGYTIVGTNAGPSNVTGATIADTVPADITGVTWTCAATGAADCDTGAAGTGASGSGNAINLAAVQINAGAGNSITITVSGTAVGAPAPVITNTATIATPSGTTDPTPANNTAATTASAQPAADLQVVKTGPATALQGDQISYTITVTNNGPSNVTGASVVDAVPAQLTGVTWTCAATGAADCDTGAAGTGASGSGNAINLAAVQINSGAANRLTLTVTGTASTPGPGDGTITNTATVATPAGVVDGNPANDSSSAPTRITPTADLAIAKTGTATVAQNGTVTYQVVVTNNGPSNVTAATITDVVPANLTAVTWTCASAGTASCGTASGAGNAIGLTANVDAGAGNSVTIQVTATATTPGAIVNTAAVQPPAGTIDRVPANDTSSQPTEITPTVDLVATKTGPASAVQGGPVTYTITVENNGPSAVSGAQVTDTVPAQMTGVSYTCLATGTADCDTGAAGTGASGTGNAISLPSVQLAPGAGNRLTITVAATATTPTAPGAATNTVTVQPPAGVTDANSANNTSSVATVVAGIPSVAVTKADAVQVDTGAAGPSPGDTLRYTITITNTGTGPAAGVTIGDLIDPNLQFVATVPAGGATFTPGGAAPFGGSLSTSPASVAAGGSLTLVYDAVVRSPLPAGATQVANQALVSGGNFPTTPSNDPDTPAADDPTVTPLTATPAVSVDKAVSIATDAAPAGPSPGDVLQYTLTVTNSGNTAATAVAVRDQIDANVTLLPGTTSASQGTVTAGQTGGPTVAATLGTVPGSGGTATLTYRVQVPNPLPAGVTKVENQAVVTGGNFPSTLSNDPSTAPAGDPTVVPLTASPAVDVTKAASLAVDADGDGIPSPGDTLLYTVAITNTGNQAATGITLTDPIDATFSSITDVTASQGTAAVAGQQLTANVGTIPGGGGTATITFRAVIPDPLPDPATTSVVNQATVSGTNVPVTPSDDPATPTVDDPTRTPLTASPLVSVAKRDTLFTDADGNGVPSPGDTLLYTMTITNSGNTTATGVALSDTVDANVVLQQATVQFSPAPASSNVTATSITATFGSIPGRGGTATATFRVRVRNPLPPGVTQVANQAVVSGTNFPATPSDDPDTPAGNDPTVTPLTLNPRISASKVDALVDDVNRDGVAGAGDEIAYTITVTNSGNQDALNVRVLDTVEPNLVLTPGSIQTSPVTTPAVLSPAFSTVFPVITGGGGTATITFRARVVNPLPLDVTQVFNQATVSGDNFPSTATDDPDTGPAGDPTATPVFAGPDVDAIKSATLASDVDGNGVVSPGDVLQYVVTISNTGTRTATDVQYFDTVGANLTIVPGSLQTSPGPPIAGGLVETATTIEALFSGVPVGSTATVSYRATIGIPFPVGVTTVSNEGFVVPGPGGNFVPVATDDPSTPAVDDPTVTPVVAGPVVTRVKTVAIAPGGDVAPSGPSAGDTLRYTVTLTNTGNQNATGASLTDTLDATFQLPPVAGPTASGGGTATLSGRTITAGWATIAPGAANAVTLTYDVAIPASLPAGVNEVRNQANVTGSNFPAGPTDDPSTPAPDDPNVTPLLAAPTVGATKTVTLANDADGNGSPSPGDTLAYEVIIRNTGNQNAAGVTYADVIDTNLILLAPVTATQGTPAIINPPSGGGAINVPDIGTIPGGGGSVTISYSALVVSPLPAGVTSVRNQGTVGGSNIPSTVTDDPTVPGTTDPTVTPLTLTPRLQATKTAALVVDADGDGVAEPGDTLAYRVTITNAGNQEATAVKFADSIEPNLTLVGGSATVTPPAPQSSLTTTATAVDATINSIPGGGGTGVITFQVTIDNPLPSGVNFVENQGTVSAAGVPAFPTDDPGTSIPNDPTRTPVVAAPVVKATKDVSIATDVAPAGPSPDDTLVYTIRIANTGNQTATGVALSDIIDPNLEVLPGSVTPDPAAPIGAVTFTAGSSAPFGGTVRATFTAIPGGGSDVTVSYRAIIKNPVDAGVTQVANQAQVSGDNFPSTPTDDTKTGQPNDPTVTPITADPKVDSTKSVTLVGDADGNGVASPGDTLAYSVEIMNSGNRAATSVAFSDTVESNLVLVPGSVTVSQGTVTAGATGGTNVAADIGTIAGGNNSALVAFRVQIVNPLPAGVSAVANQGIVSGANIPSIRTDDPRTGATDDPTVTPIAAAPAIVVDKAVALVGDADGNGTPSPGDTLQYTVTIRNTGNQGATGVALNDIVSDPTLVNLAAVQASQGTATLAGRTISAALGDIGGGGQQATVSFRADVQNPLPAGVTQVANQAQVSGTNFPTVLSNDPSTPQPGDPTVTQLAATPVVSATKRDALAVDADGDGVPSPGDTLEYTVVLTNTGNTTATGVQFSDTFDANVSYVAGSMASSPPDGAGSAVVAGSGFSGSFAAIPGGGATARLTYRVRVAAPLPAGVAQVANQTIVTPDPATGNFPGTVSDDPETPAAQDPTVTPLTSTPRIGVTKRDSLQTDADGDGLASPGDTLTYTITITNSGNGAATGVAVSDIIDANLTASAAQASQGTATLTGNTLNGALGTIPGGGGSATITYRAVVADPLPPGVTQVANQAIVTGNFPAVPSDDPDTPSAGDVTLTPLAAAPRVGVTKRDTLLRDADGNGVPSPGDTLLYTIVLTNTGNQDATGITLDDVLPAHLTGANPVASQGTATLSGQNLSATIGTIPGRGASATVTVEAVVVNPLPAGVTQVANQALVSGTNIPATMSDDPDTPAGGDPTVTPLTASPLVTADKEAVLSVDADGNGVPSPGDTLLYTITVRNTGNQAGVGTVVNDVNDPNVTLIAGSVQVSQGTVTAGNSGGGVVAVDLGAIPGGQTATVAYNVRVANPLPAGVSRVVNQATVSGTNFPTTPSNDPSTPAPDDPTATPLTASPVLSASKAAALVADANGDGLASPGETVLYTVTIQNTGNQAAANAVYADTVDANTAIVAGSVQSSQGTVTAGSGRDVGVDLGTIPAGGSATIAYRVQIAGTVPPGTTQVVNQGTLTASGLPPVRTDDPATGPLGDPTIVPLVAEPRVLVTKADTIAQDNNGDGAVGLGDSISYTLVVQNTGSTTALNVNVSDTPDPNTTLVAGSVEVSGSAGATVATGNGAGDTSVNVTIPAVGAAGERVTISFRVDVGTSLPESVTQVANQATLVCDNCPGGPRRSDDPDTTTQSDPTVTPLVRISPPSGAPALAVTKAVALVKDADGSRSVSSGDTLQYTVVVKSTGSVTARAVSYTDTVDRNTAIVARSITTTAGVVTAGQSGGGTLQVAIGDLNAGASATVRYRVTVNANLASSVRQLRNQGIARAIGIAGVQTDDPSTSAGGDPTAVPVAGRTRLAIRKVGPPRAGRGVRTTFSIRVTNRGPSVAAGVVVVDRLPSGLVVVGRPRGATVRGRTVTWRIPTLAIGRSVTLTLPVRVTAAIGTRFTNTATAQASNARLVRGVARGVVVQPSLPSPTG